MFIVPLAGDKIEARGDVKHTVLGYAAYQDQPAVYVEGTGATEAIPFSLILAVNGVAVKMTPGRVLEAVGRVKRQLQLPQKDDVVTVDGHGTMKVKVLKLAESGKLSDGMLVVGEDSQTKETLTAPLASVTKISRTDGSNDFNRRVLNTLYAEYLGSKR